MDSYLDIRTLSFISGLISVLLALFMLNVYYTSKTYDGFSKWVIAFNCNALGMILLSLRNVLPDFVSIVLANLLIISYVQLSDLGISAFFNRKPRSVVHAVLLLFVFLWFLFFTYVQPNVDMRIILISLAFTAVLFHSTLTLILFYHNTLRIPPWLLIGSYLIVGGWFLIRAVVTLVEPTDLVDFMKADSFQAIAFIVLIIGPSLSTLGFILINHNRLEIDLTLSNRKVHTLSDLIPICSNCHKIRDDQGYWDKVEDYIAAHTTSEISHSLCPTCVKELYPEFADRVNQEYSDTQNS